MLVKVRVFFKRESTKIFTCCFDNKKEADEYFEELRTRADALAKKGKAEETRIDAYMNGEWQTVYQIETN